LFDECIDASELNGYNLFGGPINEAADSTVLFQYTALVVTAKGKGCVVSAESLDSFLSSQGSPMTGQRVNFMSTGLPYNLDPRLLVASGGAESTYGRVLKAGTFNAFGLLYNSKHPYQSNYPNFAAAINALGRTLKNPAHGYNLNNTAKLYNTYCHSNCSAGLSNLNWLLRSEGGDTNVLHYTFL
jgi:hypothetical protein